MSSNKLNRFLGLTLGVAGLTGLAVPRVALANDTEKEFQEADTNGDGKLSPDEHAQWASRMFDRMDANRDGKVTAAEMTAAHKQMAGKKTEKAAEKGEMTSAEKIKKVDTNGDGVLTADEHAAAARTMFDKMDTDHDGYLTKAELKAGHEQYMHKTSTTSSSSK
jgi:Ca2+-binding EF-hand superfamily protein